MPITLVSVAELVEAPSIVPSTSSGTVHNAVKKNFCLLPFALRLFLSLTTNILF